MLGTKRMRALSAEADDALVQMQTQTFVNIYNGCWLEEGESLR